jgi:UDPglucose--hexose-1-phosphate uridylyltransferase
MNEMRRDPVTRKWVIIDKSKSAEQMVKLLKQSVEREAKKKKESTCDFCPGNEKNTAASIMELVNGEFRYRSQDPNWQTRAIPNRNPVFQIEGSLNRRLVSGYDVMDALGAHEVIIEHREHRDLDELTIDEVAAILKTYQERMVDLSKDDRFGHLFLFKNHGATSNARILHPHSTLIASPSVPERIRRELHYTRRHFQMKERCLFCDIVTEEMRPKNPNAGLIRLYDNFVSVSPFFASHSFEIWLLPRRHNSNFRNIDKSLFSELARVLQENVSVVKQAVGPLSYTLLLFTRPNKVWGEERDYWTTIDDDYHWHFKFIPRFPRQPGLHRSFSAGSGYMINHIPPETAAQILRSHM